MRKLVDKATGGEEHQSEISLVDVGQRRQDPEARRGELEVQNRGQKHHEDLGSLWA
jgi:hypothetical protein